MLNITLSPEVSEKLKSLLEEEDNEDAVVRIREVKAGAGWKSHMELRLSIDEREDEDEEQEVEVSGMPFVVNNDVVDTYGSVYNISMDENGMPSVKTPGTAKEAPACSISGN